MPDAIAFILADESNVAFTLADPEVAEAEFRFEQPSSEFAFSVAEAVPGPPGQGASITSTVTAGETLSGHRAVVLHADGMAYYASNDEPTDATRQIWLSLGAAIEGTDVEIQPLGLITEPSWNWSDDPVFLGTNGVLTQTPPVEPAFMIQLGQPTGPTTLMFNPRTPIVL